MTLCEAHAHFVPKEPGGPNKVSFSLGTQHNGQQGQRPFHAIKVWGGRFRSLKNIHIYQKFWSLMEMFDGYQEYYVILVGTRDFRTL
jgi:hypothetical protein